MPHYGDFQNETYGAGLRGIVPKLPVDFATLEQRATAAMPPHVLSYLQGGCGDEHTQDHNAAAFRHWGMVPRMMVDCTKRDLSIQLFGQPLPSPLFMAPVANTAIVPLLRGAALRNYSSDPVFRSRRAKPPEEDPATASGTWAATFGKVRG